MSNPFGMHSRYADFTHEVGFTQESLYQVMFLSGFRDINVIGSLVIRKKTLRSFLRRAFLNTYYAWTRFLYYVQDFSVPKVLDPGLVVFARKDGKAT
jgi:hypothetical protein